MKFRPFAQKAAAICFGILVLTLSPISAEAQPTWVESAGGPQVSLDWVKPSFEGGEIVGDVSTGFFTSRLLLSGQYPVSDELRIVADFPISHFKIDESEVPDDVNVDLSSTRVGNPYLGVEGRFASGLAAGGGIRLPLATTEEIRSIGDPTPLLQALALRTGALSDPGRVGAFARETLTARGYGHYTFRSPQNINLRLRSGLSVFASTGDSGRENVTLLDYGGRVWYGGGRVRGGLGLSGRTNLTGDEADSFGDRSIFFLDTALQGQFGRVRPGLVLRVPLSEEVSEVVGYSLGATLTVEL